MATTRIIPMHINKGKSIAQCLTDRTDYAKNPDKTDGGELVSSYMCNTENVDDDFLLSKKIYDQKTGRKQKNNIIAYQVRQSFKPGEITPELANKIGYELAEKITKGNHSFIVATHIDKLHIHNHIIWNSTNLECKKKFRNFWNSNDAVRKISDLLCLKNGLSIVENPKKKSKHYGQWLDDNKPLTLSDKLRMAIDEVLAEKPKSFDEFLQKMRRRGYEIKRGKHLAFKSKEQKKFIRLRSLGDDYAEENIRDVIDGKIQHKPKKKSAPKKEKTFDLVIELQNALTNKNSIGYVRWADKFNLKQFAKTMNYITENKLLDYNELKAKATAVSSDLSAITKQIKSAETRMTEISLLQKHIVQFAKTKAIYDAYKKSGYSPKFKEQNITEILLHQSAKNYFKELGLDKLPKMNDLKAEYATLLSEKKKAYSKYHSLKSENENVLNAKNNVAYMLNIQDDVPQNEQKKDDKSL